MKNEQEQRVKFAAKLYEEFRDKIWGIADSYCK